MAAATEKTAEDIRRELQELQRQHREVHLFLCPAHLEAPSLRAVCPDPLSSRRRSPSACATPVAFAAEPPALVLDLGPPARSAAS
jgi:hypothetical protein